MPLQALLHHVPFFTNRTHISVLPLMALHYMTLQCLTTCVVLITNFTMCVPFGHFLYILSHNFFLFYNIPFTFSLFGSTRYCPTPPPSLRHCPPASITLHISSNIFSFFNSSSNLSFFTTISF